MTEFLPPHEHNPLWKIVEVTNGEITGYSLGFFEKPEINKLDSFPILCQENAIEFAMSIMPRSLILGR